MENSDTHVRFSPATVLAHESAHAERYNEAMQSASEDKRTEYNNDRQASDPDYGNKEERRVITKTEQSAARKHGETSDGQITRRNHKKLIKIRVPEGGYSPEKIPKAFVHFCLLPSVLLRQ